MQQATHIVMCVLLAHAQPAPPKGVVAIAEYDFPQQFSEFSFRTLLTKGEVIGALTRIRVECAKVRLGA